MSNPTPDDAFRCHHTEPDGRRCMASSVFGGWCLPHGRERTTYTDTRSDSDVLRDVLTTIDLFRDEVRGYFATMRKELEK